MKIHNNYYFLCFFLAFFIFPIIRKKCPKFREFIDNKLAFIKPILVIFLVGSFLYYIYILY